MKYFIDTEFLEGTQERPLLLKGRHGNWLIRRLKPTIDLISIGIVAEDGREYYAISKEFNLKEAWNRFELKPDIDNGGMKKVYWLRENVLLSIYKDNVHGDMRNHIPFSYSTMKGILKGFGKTNAQIAEEVKEFCKSRVAKIDTTAPNNIWPGGQLVMSNIEFYGYYADYDWVVFCWLFGAMMNLPKGFPMYCNDLKQEIERLNETLGYNCDAKGKSYKLQEHNGYPVQKAEHNALADARWNKELYKFLKSL